MTRLGVIGGTFDPPHIGHLIISQEALIQLGLDKVIFVPAGRPLFKGRKVTRASLRWEMLALAIASNPCFTSSQTEINREGPSYTVDTLKELRNKYGQRARLYLIMGMDAFLDLKRWREPEEIVSLCHLLVARRPGYVKRDAADVEKSLPALKSCYTFIDAPFVDISSTAIRRRVNEGTSIRYLVPDAVESFIREKGLYKKSPLTSRYRNS